MDILLLIAVGYVNSVVVPSCLQWKVDRGYGDTQTFRLVDSGLGWPSKNVHLVPWSYPD